MIAIKFFIIAVDFGVLSTWKRYEKHSWTRHHEKIFIYVRACINKDFVHSDLHRASTHARYVIREVFDKNSNYIIIPRDRSIIYICTHQLLVPYWVLWIIRYTRNMFCHKIIFCRWTLFSIFIALDVLGKFHYIYT